MVERNVEEDKGNKVEIEKESVVKKPKGKNVVVEKKGSEEE